MISVSFETGAPPFVRDKVRSMAAGTVIAQDARTTLIDSTQIHARDIRELARMSMQPVEVEIHPVGATKLVNGTWYIVTEHGWLLAPAENQKATAR
jgi:hypothetical protein